MTDRDALARAEGERRWPDDRRGTDMERNCDAHRRGAFVAGAAWERETSRPDVGDLRERMREAIAQAMSIETHNPMPYTVTTDAVLATLPAPEGHPLDRLCNDPAPALNLPGAMPAPPKVYCARVKGHEPPHAHGEMTWDTLPAPVVSGEDVESVKADIAGWLKRNHTHTPSDGCRTCEWRAQEIGHLVDLWALHLGADAPEAGERETCETCDTTEGLITDGEGVTLCPGCADAVTRQADAPAAEPRERGETWADIVLPNASTCPSFGLAPAAGDEPWECQHQPGCADAACSHNPAMRRWVSGKAADDEGGQE